jgi:hypothetical protein
MKYFPSQGSEKHSTTLPKIAGSAAVTGFCCNFDRIPWSDEGFPASFSSRQIILKNQLWK